MQRARGKKSLSDGSVRQDLSVAVYGTRTLTSQSDLVLQARCQSPIIAT